MKTPVQNPVGLHLAFVAMTSCFWVCCAFCEGLAAQDNLPRQPDAIRSSSTQFLILKTGSVYSGQLEYGGGKYIIHRNNGSTIRFHQGEVDFVTHSLDNAYRQLLHRLEHDDAIGHHRLATWCLKNHQLESARQELASLKRMGGGQKTIRLLEQQIEQLANPRIDQIPVQTVSHEKPIETGVRRLPKTGPSMASRKELREIVDSFSRESLREFNRRVHLRIVNGCAAGQCHGNADNPMRLWRIDNRGGIKSTGVQRNLHAISRYINRNDPEKSVLLKYVTEIHGGMNTPAYDPTSHHFHAIRDWVLTAGLANGAMVPPSDDSVFQTSFVDPPKPVAAPVNTNAPRNSRDAIPDPVDLAFEQQRFVPRDEFDPEIFNRKFGTQQPEILRPMPVSETLKSPQPKADLVLPSSKRTRSLPPVDDQ